MPCTATCSKTRRVYSWRKGSIAEDKGAPTGATTDRDTTERAASSLQMLDHGLQSGNRHHLNGRIRFALKGAGLPAALASKAL